MTGCAASADPLVRLESFSVDGKSIVTSCCHLEQVFVVCRETTLGPTNAVREASIIMHVQALSNRNME